MVDISSPFNFDVFLFQSLSSHMTYFHIKQSIIQEPLFLVITCLLWVVCKENVLVSDVIIGSVQYIRVLNEYTKIDVEIVNNLQMVVFLKIIFQSSSSLKNFVNLIQLNLYNKFVKLHEGISFHPLSKNRNALGMCWFHVTRVLGKTKNYTSHSLSITLKIDIYLQYSLHEPNLGRWNIWQIKITVALKCSQ